MGFAAVASEYVVTSSSPDTSGYGTTECACYFMLTLADVRHILAFVFSFLTLAVRSATKGVPYRTVAVAEALCRGQEIGHNTNGGAAILVASMSRKR